MRMSLQLSNQMKGMLLVALSGTMFGSLGYLGTHLLSFHLSIENMLFWRFLIASLWIAAGMILFAKNAAFEMHAVSLMKLFILGALYYSGSSIFYFLASKQIGTGLAMVIFYSFPVFVALLAWLLGDWQVNRYAIAALVAVVLGLLLMKGQGGDAVNLSGVFFAIIAAFSYALYVYGQRHHSRNLDARLLTLLVCVGNTVIFFLYSCYTKQFLFPGTWQAWVFICAIGIVATALPIQLLLEGLKYISPVKASILSSLEPVITVLVGIVLLHESISTMQALGVMVLLSGALFIQFERSTEE